jgi:hypothetical protein
LSTAPAIAAAPLFRSIGHLPEWMPAGLDAPRHRHLNAYATIVLDGAYDQFAFAGHLRAEAAASWSSLRSTATPTGC